MLEENIGKLLEIGKKTNGTFAYISEEGQLYITDFLFSILYWIPSIDLELMESLKEIYGSLLHIPNLYKLYHSDEKITITKHKVGHLVNNKYVLYNYAHNPHHNKISTLIQHSMCNNINGVHIKDFGEYTIFNEYRNINSSYSKFNMRIADKDFIIYKNFIPVNKNDSIDIDLFDKDNYSTLIFTIYKPKGLIIKCAINFYNI